MTFVLLINVIAVGFAAVLPNDFLMFNSYVLYGLQFATMIPYLLRKARFIENLFLPTFFVLVYFLVNLTLGSYLVPRDYGWDKQFADVSMGIHNYNLIVPFLLLSNIILFQLTMRALRQLNRSAEITRAIALQGADRVSQRALLQFPFFLLAFGAIAYYDVYSSFSFLFTILIVHLTDPSLRGKWYRYPIYAAYLLTCVALDFDNKREIAMVLFLIIFLEVYYSRSLLTFSPLRIAGYLFAGCAFFGLVLTASVLRGYGDFPVSSLFDALWYVPQYMGSDMFVDGITDNLELNYNYGVTITAIDHALRGLINYQYGASLVKVLFLPLPRDLFPFKPESMMQLFTRIYAPDWWAEDGSLPVMFASDMFVNFNYAGLVPYALVWLGINRLFIAFHFVRPRSFAAYSCLFMFISVLMFARGSGLELWILYYLFAIPPLLLIKLLGNNVRYGITEQTRWVI